jgi:hypothetical protein
VAVQIALACWRGGGRRRTDVCSVLARETQTTDTNTAHVEPSKLLSKFDCFFTATSLQASFVSIKWGYHIHRGHANILEGTPILVTAASPIQVFVDPSSLFTKHYSKDFELTSLGQNHSQQYIRS